MSKSLVTGVVMGLAVASAGGVLAAYGLRDRGPEFAEVVDVQPVKETLKTPKQVCQEVTVTHRRPVQDQHQILGTGIGAVVGGVLGHQVGGGSGKKVATVAGALAGGYAGNKVQENMQANDTYTTTENRCSTVNETSEKIVGYDVAYQLEGRSGTVRMDHHPGARIPVEDGQLVLSAK